MKLKEKKDKKLTKQEKQIKAIQRTVEILLTDKLVDELSIMTQKNIDLQRPFLKATTEIKELKEQEMEYLRDNRKKQFDEKLKKHNATQESITNELNENAIRYQAYSNIVEQRINKLNNTKDVSFNGRNLWNVIKISKDLQKLINKEKPMGVN